MPTATIYIVSSLNEVLTVMKEIKLKKGKEESLGRFHPWVFSGAIATVPGLASMHI